MPARTNAAKTIIQFDYNHAPTLWRFSEDNSFVRGVLGPVGGGKSSACAIEIVRRGLAQKPGPDGMRRTRWAVIRQTHPQLEDTTIKTFFQWFPPHQFGEWRASESRFIIKEFAGTEIEILFRALDRPDQISNLLSLELTGAWVNEAREIHWSIIDALQGRLGRYPAQRDGGPTWYGVWLDTNPPDADSAWYKFFEETDHKPGFAAIFKQPSGLSQQAENLPNLPGGRRYYDNLAQGKSHAWADVYIHAKYGFVADGRPVYPEFSDHTHVGEFNPVPGRPVYRGWDFGLTPACVFSQTLPDGRWGVFDEICAEDMGAERFADEVNRYSADVFTTKRPEFIDIGDPAGMQRAQTNERTVFGILQAKGIGIQPGAQSLALRIESVRKPLNTLIMGKPQFILHPRCRVLLKGFQGAYRYRRIRVSGDRFSDQPEKSFSSHIHDGLQYVATHLFGPALMTPKHPPPPEWDMPDPTRSDTTGY